MTLITWQALKARNKMLADDLSFRPGSATDSIVVVFPGRGAARFALGY